LGSGFWQHPDQLRSMRKLDRCFSPVIEDSERRERLQGWQKAVNCTLAQHK